MNFKRMSVMDNGLMKKLLVDEKGDSDSVNTPKEQSEQESMFGNDENKKSGRPVKGYRCMFFTFFMIIILCLIVMFHDRFEKLKDDAASAASDAAGAAADWAKGKGENGATTPTTPTTP